jgi:prolyl oligopeptidase
MDYLHLILPAFLAVFCVAIAANFRETPLAYPETRKEDVTDDYFGTVVPDPYRWLEDANAEETAQWVARQNELTYAYLNQLPERAGILDRLTELYDYPRFSLPFQEGGRTFFFRNNGLQNQSVLYVQDSLDAEPRLLLDPNALSAEGTVSLNGYDVSDNGKLLVYSLSQGGSDWQEVHLKDVDTGEDRADTLQWVKFSGFTWTHDNIGFFYSRFPEPAEGAALQQANRNKKLYYHRIGTPQTEDVLIYERPDQPDWGIYSSISDDGRYLLLTLTEGTDRRNRLYYKDLGDPDSPDLMAPVVPLFDAFDASYSYLGHDERTFYVQTDKEASRSKVIAVDLTHPDPSQWKTLIPEDADVLRGISMLGDQFVALYLHNAYSEVRFYDLAGKFLKKLEPPTLGSLGGFSGRRTDTERFYAFTSYLYPTTLYRYDAKTGESTVFRKPEIKFDPAPYETRQVFYTSKDGTKVSMFLTHRKDLKRDGSNPVYLYGYGGFGASLTPGFDPSSLVWLERGGVVAIPNLRGGGEYGEEWHQGGTKLNKQNVFDDFIAAAEYLIAEKITRAGKIGIAGGSNGGLLVGATLNQRPDLFGAALPAVGVMDMLRFHLFTIGWAWKADYGSSEDPEQFAAIYAYSPLHNLKPGTHYPAVLVTTGDHDDRVVPAHSYKYAATLQTAQAGSAPTLIRIQTKAGHGAGKPMTKVLEEQADQWAFLLKNLGVDSQA